MNQSMMFEFTIVELCQRAEKLVECYARDIEAFGKCGYSRDKEKVLREKITQLKVILSDGDYEILQRLADYHKEEARLNLEIRINELRHRVGLCFDVKSENYLKYNFTKLQDLSDVDLLEYAFHVVHVAKSQLKALTREMVTLDDLYHILEDRDNMEAAINELANCTVERREKKKQRIALANDIYKLIREYSQIGRFLWHGKNEAHYTDYTICGSGKAIEKMADETKIVD